VYTALSPTDLPNLDFGDRERLQDIIQSFIMILTKQDDWIFISDFVDEPMFVSETTRSVTY
jgi:hypothetical protein